MFTLIVFAVLGGNDVKSLVRDLGDDSFEVRQRASQILAEKIDFNVYVELRDTKTKDLEVITRINCIMCAYLEKLKKVHKVNLRGHRLYPRIDEGMPYKYSLGGPWQGWKRDDFVNIYTSLVSENTKEYIEDGPYQSDLRKATKLWMDHRINHALRKSLEGANSKKAFSREIKERMKKIQQDVDMLIDGDSFWYRYRILEKE